MGAVIKKQLPTLFGVAHCLPEDSSKVGNYNPFPCKIEDREPNVQSLVEIQDPRVPLETEHYDPRENPGES